jgi:hypothetical protein
VRCWWVRASGCCKRWAPSGIITRPEAAWLQARSSR